MKVYIINVDDIGEKMPNELTDKKVKKLAIIVYSLKDFENVLNNELFSIDGFYFRFI